MVLLVNPSAGHAACLLNPEPASLRWCGNTATRCARSPNQPPQSDLASFQRAHAAQALAENLSRMRGTLWCSRPRLATAKPPYGQHRASRNSRPPTPVSASRLVPW